MQFWAAALWRLEENLAEVHRDAGADQCFHVVEQPPVACQRLNGRALRVRVVEFAQHGARADAAIDVPGALRGRQRFKEAAAPLFDIAHHGLHFFGSEDAVHRQMALATIEVDVEGIHSGSVN